MKDTYLDASAVISDDGLYRYGLSRRWGTGIVGVLWIMLNPSTADGDVDDPTIRRCVGFSKAWGYDRMRVVNLYALRCTRPIHLEHHPDPVGPANDLYLMRSIDFYLHEIAVAAWGAHVGPLPQRAAWMSDQKWGFQCLGVTKDGQPRHPLYVRADTEPAFL